MDNQSDEMVQVGDKKYPRWAVERAKEVIEKHGGKLESTVQAVLMLHEADKNAVRVDPNASGRGFSHNIGGYVVSTNEMVQVGDKKYPRWAVERAQRLVEVSGGDLERMIQSVLAVTEEMKNATVSDPSERGTSATGYIIFIDSRKKR